MRALIVSFHATVANYEYLVYWSFYQDGSIVLRSPGHRDHGDQPPRRRGSPYGTTVDHDIYAPFHQHFLVARLDLDIDGEQNTVHETHSEPLPTGPDNPHGIALVQPSTPLRTELEGRQDFDWASQRAWKVVNPNQRNALGQPVAYKLSPPAASRP